MRGWTSQVFFMELRKLITYRADFWVNFFGQTFFSLIIAYFLWESIFYYSGKEVMNGYTIQGMIFYYLIVPLIFRIQQGQGIGFISREIYDGSLNKYLLYPIGIFKYKAATYLANSGFYLLQLFLILIVYQVFFGSKEVFQFDFFYFILFVLVTIVSSLSFYYSFCSVEFLAFWFDNVWSLGVILRFGTSFLGGALIPLTFFPNWAQTLLAYTPFPYLITFPMETLTGKLSYEEFLTQFSISICWLVVFFFIAKFIWNRGKYKYSGVGI